MRTALLAALSLVSISTTTSYATTSFMPENNLWMEDCVDCKSNGMTQELFESIVKAGRDAYAGEAQARGERLRINALWSNSTVNANACRGCTSGEVTVNMYGGLARRDEVLPESFALVLCHELGHAYGGTPYIVARSQMSAEGQSDYYSTSTCFERIYTRVPALRTTHASYEPAVEELCTDNRRCRNGLAGAKGLGTLLAVLSRDPEPKFETPDTTVVDATELSYPATTQCRLDSYVAGMLNRARPLCWFHP
jgi:hypothetical protein